MMICLSSALVFPLNSLIVSSGFSTCKWVEKVKMSGKHLPVAWLKALGVWFRAGVVIDEVVMMPFLVWAVLLMWMVDQPEPSVTPSAKLSTLSCSTFFWQTPSIGWTLFIGDTKGFCFRQKRRKTSLFWSFGLIVLLIIVNRLIFLLVDCSDTGCQQKAAHLNWRTLDGPTSSTEKQSSSVAIARLMK